MAVGLGLSAIAGGYAIARETGSVPIRIEADPGFKSPVLDTLSAYAGSELKAFGLPGMIISAVDDKGRAAKLYLGWANVERQEPLNAGHLFQIGSISKSIVALCIHSIAEEGRIDLQASVSDYLPTIPWPEAPISIQQLLNHTSGLTREGTPFPSTPGGRLWSGFRPGSSFSYSNLGYYLLGLLISQVQGVPHSLAIRDRVLRPLGMEYAKAHCSLEDRSSYPTGYIPMREDRPELSRAQLVPGLFEEFDHAAGCVTATAPDMVKYLEYMLALARGEGAPILSRQAAKRFLENGVMTSLFGAGTRYMNGVGEVDVDGLTVLHHTGGEPMFSSAYHADPKTGVACFASVNGRLAGYRPALVSRYGVQILRAAEEGSAVPRPVHTIASAIVDDGGDWIGHYSDGGAQEFELRMVGGRMEIFAQGESGRIEKMGENKFKTDHSAFQAHALEFAGHGADAKVWWGGTLFGKLGASQPPLDPAIAQLTGIYTDGDPLHRVVIFARGQELVWEERGALSFDKNGYWYAKADVGSVTRLWFSGSIAGRPTVLNVNGRLLLRFA
jgi:CubicO group peptidase (beta-lactamase class C family)